MTTNNYYLKILTDWQQVEDLKDEWQALLERSDADCLFNTFLWHQIWWHSFFAGKKLRVVAVFRQSDNQLVALAPLVLVRQKILVIFKYNQLRFLGEPDADCHDFIIDNQEPAELSQFLIDKALALAKNEQAVASFNELNEKSKSADLLNNWSFKRKLSYVKNTCYRLSYQKIGAGELKNLINKHDTRAKLKKLLNLSNVSYKLISDQEALSAALEKFFDFFQKRAGKKGYSKFFSFENYRRFFLELTEKFFQSDWLRLWSLELDGQVTALDICFQYKNNYYRYLPTFNQDLAAISPGSILLEHILDEAKDQARFFDFLRGGEHYKKRYTNEEYKNYSFNFYPNFISFQSALCWHKIKVRLKKIRIILKIYRQYKPLVVV